MFHAIVNVTVYDRRACRAIVQRNVELPFPPSSGIDLGWTDLDTDEWSGHVETVIWSVGEEMFHVEMEDWVSGRMLLDEMLEELGPAWRRIDRAA